MDLASFERLESTFEAFHDYFAGAFGRKQWRGRSRDYLRGLLVQASERGNAENLSEAVSGASPRVLQRFLTEARWDDLAVTRAIQAYASQRLGHPEAVWIVDGSDFPKQGRKSAGVARQYCGALGKIANCQAGIFLAYSSPRGRALVDKRLFLPRVWTDDPDRCAATGIPESEREYRMKTEIALQLLKRAQEWDELSARWVTGDDHFGQSRDFREGVAAAGWLYVLEVPGHLTAWPEPLTWEEQPYRGLGRPTRPRPRETKQTLQAWREALPPEAWREVVVAEGAQGPRRYRFAWERVRESRSRDAPGEVLWLIHKENLDGTEPRHFFSNAPPDMSPEVLARVAMSRWPIETEFEEQKSQVALDEYEVRSWFGWHHHMTMCILAGLFLLSLQQDWGEKDAAVDPAPGVSDRLRTLTREALGAERTTQLAADHPTAQCCRETKPRQEEGTGPLRSCRPCGWE